MDNVENVATTVPQGQTDATNQTPDTSSGETPRNDAAGVEQPQTREGQSEGAEAGLILGKFKSQEDLEKAYQELQSHNTKVEMERSELEKLFVQPEQKAEDVSQPEPKAQTEELSSIIEKMRPALSDEVTRLLSPAIAKLEVQDMVNKYGDKFVSVAKDVARIKSEKKISMEDAFKLATYPTVERTSFNQGVQRANEATQQAQKAIVESSRPSGYKPTTVDDAIKNAKSSEELAEVFAALGPEYKMFEEISRQRTVKRPK